MLRRDYPPPDYESNKRKGVVITDLEDGTVLEPLNTSLLDGATNKCDIRSNIEQDVNIATKDETKRVQDQTTYDVMTRVEPQVDQTNVTTRVQDEHASPGKYHKNIDFNWDEPIFNESNEGDYNADKPLFDPSDHIDFNWEELVLGTVGKDQATEQPVHQATEHIECNWDEQAVDNVYYKYNLSNELESLNSDKDADEPR
ncbi:hypothetical protein Adt_23811 [Abeliophyllum distichum]|uniref:Uncharacterized protein n=1 Tax=Abeliophyllum distichum TaxID=126358 RepID=A0ABD1SBY9_9LAMI